MSIQVSANSLSNRRLYLKNRHTLIDFSAPAQQDRVTLGVGLDSAAIESLPPDLVSIGTHALRLHAADVDGHHPRSMSFTYTPDTPFNLVGAPMLTFAISAYDGDRTSQYFAEVAENKYFVEKPDPLLVSHSYITVTLIAHAETASRTVQLTNYGFNRIYANFAGESILSGVEAIRFDYFIEEEVPGWQRILKLDTVEAAMSVDFTFGGDGMETLFETSGGTVLHRAGALTFTQAAADDVLTLPDLTDAKDTICDVFLPVKNTVLLRLAASTPSLELTLQFKTDADNTYSPDREKTFRLDGVNRPSTVYLNLSDHPAATGRLTGLRLLPRAEAPLILTLWKVAFEQEERLCPTAGRFTACVSDTAAETVRFTCEIDPTYRGGTLRIYDVYPSDIHPDFDSLECVATASLDAPAVTLTGSLMRGNVTRIASQFMGVVTPPNSTEVIPLDGRTLIENWQDICGENPYPFTLPARTFTVTDPAFGAVGDGFANDTDAIQAAIDAAHAAGGGIVIIPGGVHPACGRNGRDMGRRYLVTNLRMRSFVELRIERGAILWQSDDIAHYKTLPRFGHNVSMTGVNWPANHTSGNMPLIYAHREEHFRITGGGTIRLCDTESASEDGLFRFIGDNVCIGCCDRMHVCPIGIAECDTFEVSNLAVIRCSGIYLGLSTNRHGYLANLLLDEAKCTGADGMWPSGSDGMCFTRMLYNANDDGICLSTSYNDPRDTLWVYTYPGTDRSTRNIELSHSRFRCNPQGSAISFCVWGTDGPELEKHEVRDIHIFDTVLEGRLSIGGWTDNPYYGVTPFDCSETDDFSPIKNLRIHNCELKSSTDIGNLRIPNFENDLGLSAATQFERGDFCRRPAEQNPYWTLGLSGWSFADRTTVEPIRLYDVACAVLKPMRGKACDLWQGLTLTAGTHTMRFRYKAGGTFRAFVRHPEDLCRPTGTPPTLTSIFEERITTLPGGYIKGHDWQEAAVTFTVPEDGLYHLGVEGDWRELIALYVTDFSLDP